MKEYIERAATLSAVRRAFDDEECDCEVMPVVFKALQEVEATDVVEVRHGRWTDKGFDGDFSWQIDGHGACWRVIECSACQCKTKVKTKYCPNCGARMDKEDEHEAG